MSPDTSELFRNCSTLYFRGSNEFHRFFFGRLRGLPFVCLRARQECVTHGWSYGLAIVQSCSRRTKKFPSLTETEFHSNYDLFVDIPRLTIDFVFIGQFCNFVRNFKIGRGSSPSPPFCFFCVSKTNSLDKSGGKKNILKEEIIITFKMTKPSTILNLICVPKWSRDAVQLVTRRQQLFAQILIDIWYWRSLVRGRSCNSQRLRCCLSTEKAKRKTNVWWIQISKTFQL